MATESTPLIPAASKANGEVAFSSTGWWRSTRRKTYPTRGGTVYETAPLVHKTRQDANNNNNNNNNTTILVVSLCGFFGVLIVLIASLTLSSSPGVRTDDDAVLGGDSLTVLQPEPGDERATLFAQCRPRLPPRKNVVGHRTDVVMDSEHRYVFVDNVKAGSTTVRQALHKMNQSWCPQQPSTTAGLDMSAQSDCRSCKLCECGSFGGWCDADQSWCKTQPSTVAGVDMHAQSDCVSCKICQCDSSGPVFGLGRTTTACIDSNWTKGKYVFSFVRDPVKKFESGVRQAKFATRNSTQFANKSADEILDMVLRTGSYVNEHLQPSSYRLNGYSRDGELLSYDFIGSLETFAVDFAHAMAELRLRGAPVSDEIMNAGNEHANDREEDPTSMLSDEGVKKMCESTMYAHEWECFGYRKPAVCQ